MSLFKRHALIMVIFAALSVAASSAIAVEVGQGGIGREEAGVKKDVIITSNEMFADGKDNSVIFRGNVVAEGDFMLCSDELTVVYDEKEDIKEITAKGDVRVVKEKKAATSDEAVYDKEKRAIILTGNAMAKECSDVVRGDKITVYLDSDTMSVEGGAASPAGRVKAVIMPKKECKEGINGQEFRCTGSR